FTYRPLGFDQGLIVSSIGLVVALALIAWPRRVVAPGPAHGWLGWPRRWPWIELAILVAIVAASSVEFGRGGRPPVHRRWSRSWPQFSWGDDSDPMRLRPRR